MIGKTLNLQEQLKGRLGCGEENPIEEYALESFARQVDDNIQKELLTRLILDHSSIAREMEDLYNNLRRSEAALKEAQQIAMLVPALMESFPGSTRRMEPWFGN